jgi:chromosome segregation ATPase
MGTDAEIETLRALQGRLMTALDQVSGGIDGLHRAPLTIQDLDSAIEGEFDDVTPELFAALKAVYRHNKTRLVELKAEVEDAQARRQKLLTIVQELRKSDDLPPIDGRITAMRQELAKLHRVAKQMQDQMAHMRAAVDQNTPFDTYEALHDEIASLRALRDSEQAELDRIRSDLRAALAQDEPPSAEPPQDEESPENAGN